MSRSCQSATFSRPTSAFARTTRASPQMRSADDRVALVRHRRRALLAAAERLLDLAHLGACEMTDLGREAVERRGDERQRRRAARRGGRAAGSASSSARARGRAARRRSARPPDRSAAYCADRARELADAQPVERMLEPHAVALERERPAGELQPERRRLGVDAVCAPHAERLAVLLCARDDGAERALEPSQHERARVLDGERERGVEHVRRGEAEVEPAPVLAEGLRDRVDERRDVVVRLALELGDPLRRRRTRARGDPLDGVGAARRRPPPSRRAPPARPRACARASPRPTRSALMAGRE